MRAEPSFQAAQLAPSACPHGAGRAGFFEWAFFDVSGWRSGNGRMRQVMCGAAGAFCPA
jgi:hypothetical protein